MTITSTALTASARAALNATCTTIAALPVACSTTSTSTDTVITLAGIIAITITSDGLTASAHTLPPQHRLEHQGRPSGRLATR